MSKTIFDDVPHSDAQEIKHGSEPLLWWRPPGHSEVFTLIPDASGTSTFHANHIKGVRSGWVHGTATLRHRGGRLHVWNIDICNDEGELVCTSRLTVMIVPRRE